MDRNGRRLTSTHTQASPESNGEPGQYAAAADQTRAVNSRAARVAVTVQCHRLAAGPYSKARRSQGKLRLNLNSKSGGWILLRPLPPSPRA